MIPSKFLGTLHKHKDEVWQVKFSPCGTRLASIGKDNLIFIWSISKPVTCKSLTKRYRFKCTLEIRGHTKIISSLNWSFTPSPDEQQKTGGAPSWLVTSSHDGSVRVWDAARTGRNLLEIVAQNQQEQMMCASFIPGYENTRLLTLSNDKLLTLYEVVRGAGEMYSAVEMVRVQTRNFMEIAVNERRIVVMG